MADISFLVFEDEKGFYRLEGNGPIEERQRIDMTKEEADAWTDKQYLIRLPQKLRKMLKTIAISEVVYRHDAGTTDEKEVTRYVVTVNEEEGRATEEPFETIDQAQEYAAEVAKRDLRPFDFSHILEPR